MDQSARLLSLSATPASWNSGRLGRAGGGQTLGEGEEEFPILGTSNAIEKPRAARGLMAARMELPATAQSVPRITGAREETFVAPNALSAFPSARTCTTTGRLQQPDSKVEVDGVLLLRRPVGQHSSSPYLHRPRGYARVAAWEAFSPKQGNVRSNQPPRLPRTGRGFWDGCPSSVR